LDLSGENRDELENVLQHYNKTGDREKYAAAEYLILNMPGHKSMSGDYVSYYKLADSILSQNRSATETLDDLEALASDVSNIKYTNDIETITSEYLIRDIDHAFTQWREGEWAKHLNFTQFCEWLLPYTCSNEQPVYYWRDSLEHFAESYIGQLKQCKEYRNNPRAAVCRVNNRLIDSIKKQKWIHSPHGHKIFAPETFIKLPGATCEEYAEIATLIMRSKGIPVGIDFTSQWPDRLYGHSWCVFPNLRGKTSMFNPFASNPDYPHYSHAGFAKVFRRTYSHNEEYLALLRRNKGNVPDIFKTPFFFDVTGEYEETSDLEIDINPVGRIPHGDVYIAVFDNSDWKPVYWGKAKGKKAMFKGMGRNITYMAMAYDSGELIPLSVPFYVDLFGNVEYFIDDKNVMTDFELWRKYPMFQHVFIQKNFLLGGYVEASDRQDFKDSEIVARLPQWELTSGQVRISQTQPYRYWRFCADSGTVADMAEMFFYIYGCDTPMSPRALEASSEDFCNLYDKDPLTNFSAEGDLYKGAFDFGKSVTIEHISFIRRGDGNAIMPGDSYQLFIWSDNRWKLHSEYLATDVKLEVKNIPDGALCYIKGLSRGVQNRIFRWNTSNQEIEWH